MLAFRHFGREAALEGDDIEIIMDAGGRTPVGVRSTARAPLGRPGEPHFATLLEGPLRRLLVAWSAAGLILDGLQASVVGQPEGVVAFVATEDGGFALAAIMLDGHPALLHAAMTVPLGTTEDDGSLNPDRDAAWIRANVERLIDEVVSTGAIRH